MNAYVVWNFLFFFFLVFKADAEFQSFQKKKKEKKKEFAKVSYGNEIFEWFIMNIFYNRR